MLDYSNLNWRQFREISCYTANGICELSKITRQTLYNIEGGKKKAGKEAIKKLIFAYKKIILERVKFHRQEINRLDQALGKLAKLENEYK